VATGQLLIAQHLARMMLVQALRLHLPEQREDRGAWFFALANKRMSAAISTVHSRSAHRWTL
jgi:hypothetical protein